MLAIRLLAAVAVFTLGACAAPLQRSRTADPSHIPNLSAVKQAIKDYRGSGHWDADVGRVADECLAFADRARTTVERPAVVFDIDETLLSNWPYEIDNDFARSIPLFGDWARRAECQPIEPVTMRDAGSPAGDQQSDLEGGHAAHVCKVPNPMYLIP